MLRQSNLRRTPATEARSDPLFEQYPQNGEFRLQSGVVVKTPFHAYQADACILAGTVDASAARRLLRPTGLEPVLAARDRAYAEIWVTDYQDTGLGSEPDPVSGAYTEAAFAFLASAGTTTVPWRNRFSPLKAAAMEQSWRVIHQLVLPSDKQVA
ncbi:MAG TPA: hypothetical protein VFB75_25870, partial [Burkholderiales bacterium]|nr:hypothetical protein [Burkholderiales bacterium]